MTKFYKYAIYFLLIFPPIIFFTDLTRNPYYFQIFLLNVIILIIWIVFLCDSIKKGSIKIVKSPVDMQLLLFTSFAVLTWFVALFSRQPYLVHGIIEDGIKLAGFNKNYLYSSIYSEGFKKLIFTVVNILLSYYIAALLIPVIFERQDRAKFFNAVVKILYFVGFVASFYAILQYLGMEPIWPKALNPFGGRPVSTFGNPNFMSSYLVMLFPLILAGYLSQISSTKKFFYLITLEMYFCSIVATMTRSSWMGLLTVISVMLFFLYKDYKNQKNKSIFIREKKWIIALVCFVGLTFLFWPRSSGGSTPISRITEIKNVSKMSYGPMHQRIMIWSSAWGMVKDDPVFGKGWGLFELFYPFYQGKSLFNELYRGFRTHANNAHNEILEYWSQIGSVGLALYLWFLVSVITYGIKLYQSPVNEEKKLIVLALVGGTSGMFIDNIFGNVSTQFCVPAFLFWFNMGLISGLDDSKKIETYKVNGFFKGIFALVIVVFIFFIIKWFGFFAGEINYFEGFKYSKKGDVAGSIPYLEKAHENNSEVNSEYELGNCYARVGDKNKAIWSYYNALGANCGYDEIHFNLATVYTQQGDMQKAMQNYTQSLYINPISQESYFALGNVFLNNIDKYNDDAIALFERAAIFFPQNMDFWNNLGFAYTKKNEHKKAVEAYRKAVELNPDFQMAKHNLQIALDKAGMKYDPILEYDNILKQAEKNIEAKNWPEVQRLSKKLVEIFPGSYKAHFYYANANFTLGNIDLAINHYREVINLSTNNLPAWLNLGLAYMQKNDRAGAMEAFEKVLELDPKNQMAQERLNALR
ncbi:MAG: hypothetical protein A2252_08550 [Elusimicrobia bacterium RIFOXYA2_FULL_39_19]|nr:MAG: hypothetical protein A2252_08550 [Elusimicrobia bacterium RIFOXYA2_FULL_39_19]